MAFHKEMSLLVRLGDVTHKLRGLQKPTTIEELEKIIKTVDDYVLCPGGLPSTQYNDVISQCCYKDGDYWRHVDCAKIIDQEVKICIPCRNVPSRLQQAVKRGSFSGDKLPILDMETFDKLTPKRKGKILKTLNRRLQNQRQTIARKTDIIKELRNTLEEEVEKMRTWNYESLNEMLNDKKIPPAQVFDRFPEIDLHLLKISHKTD